MSTRPLRRGSQPLRSSLRRVLAFLNSNELDGQHPRRVEILQTPRVPRLLSCQPCWQWYIRPGERAHRAVEKEMRYKEVYASRSESVPVVDLQLSGLCSHVRDNPQHEVLRHSAQEQRFPQGALVRGHLFWGGEVVAIVAKVATFTWNRRIEVGQFPPLGGCDCSVVELYYLTTIN